MASVDFFGKGLAAFLVDVGVGACVGSLAEDLFFAWVGSLFEVESWAWAEKKLSLV